MELYIIIALAVICVVLAVAVVAVAKKPKDSGQTAEQLAVNSEKIASLGTQLNSEFERSRRETQLFQKDSREETAQGLKEMSRNLAEMTKANSEYQAKLINALNESLNSIRLNNIEQNEKQSRIIAESVEKMRESNEKKLEQMRLTVDEKLTSTLTTRLDSSFKTVSVQLENVNKSLGEMKELSNGVTANVTTLNRVLTNVKARGTWAEVQLGAILDQTIPNMYETNFATHPNSKERVEFAVRIPSGDDSSRVSYLPIDSKFPMEDYIRLCDAADAADAPLVAAMRKALEDRVLSEAKTISKYINVPTTTPFAIMYLATEGLYAEIASSRSGLPERMQKDFNVMIAGPTTITALLNSLSMGFRAVAINEKANEVRLMLSAAKTQYDKFGILLDKAKKKIDEAGKTLEDAQHRNNIIQKNLKGVESIEEASADKVLGITETADE